MGDGEGGGGVHSRWRSRDSGTSWKVRARPERAATAGQFYFLYALTFQECHFS